MTGTRSTAFVVFLCLSVYFAHGSSRATEDFVSAHPILPGTIHSIVIDDAGNRFLCGHFSYPDPLDFNTTPGVDAQQTRGYVDAGVIRINADGTYGWTRLFGGSEYDGAEVLKLVNGTLYVGIVTNSTDYEGPGGFLLAAENMDSVILALDPQSGDYVSSFGQGGAVWIGGSGDDEIVGLALAGDELYASLSTDSATLESDTGLYVSRDPGLYSDIAVVDLSAATGVPTTTFGTQGVQFITNGNFGAGKLTVANSTVFVSGYASAVNGGVGGPGTLTTSGYDAIVVALDAVSGLAIPGFGNNGFQTLGGGLNFGVEVATNADSVFLAGRFSSPNAGVGGLGPISSRGASDGFVLALDINTGAPRANWGVEGGGVTIVGGPGVDAATSIAVDGNVLMVSGWSGGPVVSITGYDEFNIENAAQNALAVCLDTATGQPVLEFGRSGLAMVGGIGSDIGLSIAGRNGSIILAGYGYSGWMGINGAPATIYSAGLYTGFAIPLEGPDTQHRITSPLYKATYVNEGFQYQIQWTGTPDSFNASNLPPGLAINNATGEIYGVPTVFGDFQIALFASDSANSASATLHLLIRNAIDGVPPEILGPLEFSQLLNEPFYYAIQLDRPGTIEVFGLPPEITFDGVGISGTLVTDGTYYFDVVASNEYGSTSKTLIITTVGPPIFTGPLEISVMPDEWFYFPFPLNRPAYIYVEGLPPELSFDNAGVYGVLSIPGQYEFPVTASNEYGELFGTLRITVIDPVPHFISPLEIVLEPYEYLEYEMLTDRDAWFSVDETPPEFYFDGYSRIYGNAGVPGNVYSIVINAENEYGRTTATLNIRIQSLVPEFYYSSVSTVEAGSPDLELWIYGYGFVPTSKVYWNGQPRPTTWYNDGVVSVSLPASDFASPGFYPLTVRNPGPGGGETEPFDFEVLNVPPQIISPLEFTHDQNEPFYHPIQINQPGTIEVFGLLPGMTFDGSAVSGLLETSGTYYFDVLAYNDYGGNWATLIITIGGVPNFNGPLEISVMPDEWFYFQFPLDRPCNIEVGGLPPELTFDSFGVYGFLSIPGQYEFPVTASNEYGERSGTLRITIVDPIPHIISPLEVVLEPYEFLDYEILTDHNAWFSVDEMPPEFYFDGYSRIYGYAEIPGSVHSIVINAENEYGRRTETLTIRIRSLVPEFYYSSANSTDVGSPELELWIYGFNFVPTSQVLWNGQPRPTTYYGYDVLTVSLPASDFATSGVFPISVRNPGPGGGETQPNDFTVIPVPPIISGPFEFQLPVGEPFDLVFHATGNPSFTFDLLQPIEGLSWNSAGELSGQINEPGRYYLSVVAENELGTDVVFVELQVFVPTPVVESLNVASITYGEPSYEIIVYGQNFRPESWVITNHHYMPAIYVSPTEVRVIATPPYIYVPSLSVWIYDPDALAESNIITIPVLPGTPQITWTAPAPIVYGTPLSGIQLNAQADVSGWFDYTPTAGTILPAGTHELDAVFFTQEYDNYAIVSATVPLVVQKATPSVAWSAPAPISYGEELSTVQLNATANIAGAFIYTPALGDLLARGTHTLSVQFIPNDAANYVTATASVTLSVLNNAPTIESIATATPNPVRYNVSTTLAVSADDSDNDTLTYAWNFGDGSPVGSGAGVSHTYTAAGTYTAMVTVTDGHGGAVTSSVTVNVLPNSAPTVAMAASAAPAIVGGTSTSLSVLGADDTGESLLTYHWALIGSPPAAVTFSANGTNAAKLSTATFAKAGTYTFRVTVRDPQNAEATSDVAVTVNQTMQSITVSPGVASTTINGTQQFAAIAIDQFGLPMATQPAKVWTVTGGGTISAGGLFTAGNATGGPFTVSAAVGAISGTASVSVTVNAGLKAEYFDFTTSLSAIPNLAGISPTVTRVDAQINYPSTASAWSGLGSNFANTFAARYTGYIFVPTAGNYTLYLDSDEGSKLCLDGTLLVDNDGTHNMRERSGTRTLAVGYHSVHIEYFENTGNAGLIFNWKGPGISKTVIPANRLFHGN